MEQLNAGVGKTSETFICVRGGETVVIKILKILRNLMEMNDEDFYFDNGLSTGENLKYSGLEFHLFLLGKFLLGTPISFKSFSRHTYQNCIIFMTVYRQILENPRSLKYFL